MASTAPLTGSTPGLIRTFLLDHERLILVVVVAVVLWFGYGKYAQIQLEHDQEQLAAQKLITDAQVKANQQLAQQVAADAQQLKSLSDKVEAQNQQLANANVALVTALTKQQKTDASLPIPDLVSRWAQLVPGTDFAGTIDSGNNVKVTPANAVATVQQLEKVPVLTTELANERQQKQNDEQLLVAANKSILDLNGNVTGLNSLIVDNTKQCQTQIKVIEDEARKSKRKWFVIGYIAGFATKAFLTVKGF